MLLQFVQLRTLLCNRLAAGHLASFLVLCCSSGVKVSVFHTHLRTFRSTSLLSMNCFHRIYRRSGLIEVVWPLGLV